MKEFPLSEVEPRTIAIFKCAIGLGKSTIARAETKRWEH